MKTHISFSENGDTPFSKLLGHNAEILKSWNQLEDTFFNSTSLEANLLEQVRRTLAYGNKCQYCMAKGEPDTASLNKRESYATAFAELFVSDHLSIVEDHFKILKEVFSEVEVAELCSFISFITAAQRLGAIYNLTPDAQHE